MKKSAKSLSIIFIAVVIFTGLCSALYFKGIPLLVKTIFFKNIVQEYVYKFSGYELFLDEPEFKPSLKPAVIIHVGNLVLSKDKVTIVALKNTTVKLSFAQVLRKRLRIRGLYSDEIYVDLNGFPKEENEKEKKKSGFKADFLSSELNIKKLLLNCDIENGTKIKLSGKNLKIKRTGFRERKVEFDLAAVVAQDKKKINISATDNGKATIDRKCLVFDNVPINIDGSVIHIIMLYGEDRLNLNSESTTLNAATAYNLAEMFFKNEKNKETFENFKNIKGSFRYNINYANGDYSGNIEPKNLGFDLTSAENMPFVFNNGLILFSDSSVEVSGLKGFYCGKQENKFDITGKIKDGNADFTANAVITDDFARKYLSKKAGYPIDMRGSADTRIVFNLKNKKADVLWLYRFIPGSGFIIDGEDFGSIDSERVLVSKMKLDPYYLDITSLDYFVGSPKDENFNKKPILSFYGKIDLKNNCRLLNFGFKIPEYLTSRFFNLLFREELFRRGTVKGELEYVNTGAFPTLRGHLSVEKAGIPSQRLFIRNALLKTDGSTINLTSEGKYKSSDYKISADVLNRILFPIIVKDINLTVDNIDVEKFMTSVNASDTVPQNDEESADNTDFSKVVVEKGELNLIKGVYKNIKFDNVLAKFSYDKNQILKIVSNKFNFAEGISSAEIICNLKDKLYSAKLEVEEVNSDLIANSLLGLYDEISGKATGIMELNTDKSLKLNGNMDFQIKNGAIAKIGLFEYILKFTTILRNPVVTISPSMVMDIVNIPKGEFDIINGSLKIKDNIINHISISSSSPQISSYIGGKYDIDHRDSAIRIYIKFGNKAKGLYGLVRNISLSSLANKTPFGAKTSNNFYEREIEKIPALEENAEKDSKIYLVKIDGDIGNNNFISFLKKLK